MLITESQVVSEGVELGSKDIIEVVAFLDSWDLLLRGRNNTFDPTSARTREHRLVRSDNDHAAILELESSLILLLRA